MPAHDDLTHEFNTPLNPQEEANFQKWAKENKRDGDLYDYDMRGAWRAGIGEGENGHYPDTYKKPNHPTFSNESQYHGSDSFIGGSWGKDPDGRDTFVPGPGNLVWRPLEHLQDYFREREPEAVLLPPRMPLS